MMKEKIVVALLSDALLLGGVVVIMVGLYTIWPPLAAIAGGVLAILLSILMVVQAVQQ